MKAAFKMILSVTAGVLFCVLSEVNTDTYCSYLDLLFENTSQFADYNLTRFDLIHILWFSFFHFTVLSSIQNNKLENSSFFRMSVHRAGIRKTTADSLRQILLSSAMIYFTSASAILIIFLLFQKNRLPLRADDYILSAAYYLRSMLMSSSVCFLHFDISLCGFPQDRCMKAYMIPALLLFTDLAAGTSLITFSGECGKELLCLTEWLLILLLITLTTNCFLRKRGDIL